VIPTPHVRRDPDSGLWTAHPRPGRVLTVDGLRALYATEADATAALVALGYTVREEQTADA
jgi:hypothetical protein